MPVGVVAAARAIAAPAHRRPGAAPRRRSGRRRRPRRRARRPSARRSPPTTRAAATSRASSGPTSRTARRLASAEATSSGCATAVSRMVSASDVVPWATRSRPVVRGGPRDRLGDGRQLEPRGEHAGGLGALTGADDDEHPYHSACRSGLRQAHGVHQPCPVPLCDSYNASITATCIGQRAADGRRGSPRRRAGPAPGPSAARTTRGRPAGPSPSRRPPCAGGSAPCWGARRACGRPPRASARCRGRPTGSPAATPGWPRAARTPARRACGAR